MPRRHDSDGDDDAIAVTFRLLFGMRITIFHDADYFSAWRLPQVRVMHFAGGADVSRCSRRLPGGTGVYRQYSRRRFHISSPRHARFISAMMILTLGIEFLGTASSSVAFIAAYYFHFRERTCYSHIGKSY